MKTYVIRAGEDGPVKIGRADDPHQRLRELQTGNAVELSIVRVFESDFDAEPYFHFKFRDLRIRGEWFHFSAEMMDFSPVETVVPFHNALKFKSNDEPVTLGSMVAAAVRAEWGDDRRAPRLIADATGCSIGAAKNWLHRSQLPSGEHLVKLMAASVRVRALMLLLRSRSPTAPMPAQENLTNAVAYLLGVELFDGLETAK